MRTLLVLTCVTGFVAAAGPNDADLKRMAGTWTMVSGEEEGKDLSADVVKSAKLVITGNKHDVHVGANHIVGTHAVDSGKKLKTIDATDTEGRFKGQTTLGIYELKAGEFKVCFAPPGKERPKDFTTKSGTGTILHVWKRVK